jgi:hypothetical protein
MKSVTGGGWQCGHWAREGGGLDYSERSCSRWHVEDPTTVPKVLSANRSPRTAARTAVWMGAVTGMVAVTVETMTVTAAATAEMTAVTGAATAEMTTVTGAVTAETMTTMMTTGTVALDRGEP